MIKKEQLVLTNNDEAGVASLGVFVKGFCAALCLDAKTTSGIRLAVEEAVVNVMSYSYPEGETGKISILAESDDQQVRFTLIDSGTPFDPTAVMEADTTEEAGNRPIGGLGILLTRKLMDSVSYCRKDGNNVLTMTKIIV